MKEVKRCPWLNLDNELYKKYHDLEWGVPVYNDKKIFELLVLESFQAGLSWQIILNKRENFKKAFANFDFEKIAKFNKRDVERLMKDSGIVRNRLKIEATIENAKNFLKVRKEFGTFSKYMWSFVFGKRIVHKLKTLKDYPEYIKEAEIFAKDLKRRGFKFLGPKVVYAHMQASGMVNDHTVSCFRYRKV